VQPGDQTEGMLSLGASLPMAQTVEGRVRGDPVTLPRAMQGAHVCHHFAETELGTTNEKK
jgi:hypothetical protein